MPRANHQSSASDLAGLNNLGPKSAAMLASVGITTLAQLRARGAIAAYAVVKHKHASASFNLLYALVGVLEDCDWKTVQRERKLALMLALEDYQREHPARVNKAGSEIDELSRLRNIGKAMRADFDLLGIQSVKELANSNADELYARIQQLTHTRHDPCVWDTYAAAIHQAKTGEALAWWEFTKVRKARQAMGTFAPLAPSPGCGRGMGRGQANAGVRTTRIATTVKQNPLPALSHNRERGRSTKR